VFNGLLFRQHLVMPARKPKRNPHRTRFGRNIALLRRQRHLTQEKLAEKVGTSPRYVQSIEAGEYFPSLPTLARLKIALRCKWHELFGGCDKV
jgi:DNA-binding XRE family transcriptional regulator